MPVGKISGQMLENNLTRSGVDLAFETNLVYLDVTNSRVGINTTSPSYLLDVNGTTRSTNIEVSGAANIGNISISGNTISSTTSTINFLPSGINAAVYNARVNIGSNLELEGNVIRTVLTNTDINLTPNGTGLINLNGNTLVTGNLHVTGAITADGDIQLGDANTDNIVFNADINSNIIPNVDITYSLGSPTNRWTDVYAQNITSGSIGVGSVITGTLTVTGLADFIGDVSVTGLVTLNASIDGHLIPNYNNRYDLGNSTNIWRNLYIGQVILDSLEINDNYVRTTVSNSNLELRANGTGSVVVDQLSFKSNIISSNTTNTNIQLTPNGTGSIILSKNTSVTGNLTVSGNVTINGNTTITGITVLNSSVSGNIIPTYNNSYDLGSSSSYWGNVYAGQVILDSLEINDNYIRTTVSNANLELRSSGTGSVVIDQLSLKSNLISSNTTNTDIQINPNGTGKIQLLKDTIITGNLDVSGNVTVGGNFTFNNTAVFNASINSNIVPTYNNSYDLGSSSSYWRNIYAGQFLTDNIEVNDNYVRTTVSNSNLELRANGTGSVVVDQLSFKSNTIISNTTNTDIQINPNGTGKIQLLKDTAITGNLDVSGNVTVGGNFTFSNTPVFNAGINSNLIPFYTNTYDIGSSTSYWRNIYAGQFLTDNIEINDNYVRTTVSNSNLELRSNGTGSVVIDQLSFKTNTLTSNATNTDIQINPNGTGKIQLLKDTIVSGNLNVSGASTFNGPVVLNSSFNINSTVNGSLIPSLNNSYDVGSSSSYWRNIYAGQFLTDNIEVNDNYVRTTVSNSNLELLSNGTGSVVIDQLSFKTNALTSNTTNTDIQISPNGLGKVQLLKDTDITGNLTVTGNFTLGGNITIGDQTVDTVNFAAQVQSNILPVAAYTYDLGSASLSWRDLYAGRIFLDSLEINDNYITTTVSNANLEFRANGTGGILIEDLLINQNIISSTQSNQDIILTPTGSGIVRFNTDQSVALPAGTDAQRPLLPTSGMIRYNSTANVYEGYNGSYWIQLGGLISVDRKTYITPEATPGTNDNTIRFVTDNYPAATLTSSSFNVNALQVDDIRIDNNTISTTATNADLTLNPNGTGAVVIDNFRFINNTITNTVSGSVTELYTTGTGYWKFPGTNGIVIPSGPSSARPAAVATGMIRYNTELGISEVWDGTTWVSVAGASSGINQAQAEEIAATFSLIFG